MPARPSSELIRGLVEAGADGVTVGNLWLALWTSEQRIGSIESDGAPVRLPRIEGDGIVETIEDPVVIARAIWDATRAAPELAKDVQATLEGLQGAGFVAEIVVAAITATAAIVGAACGVVQSKEERKAQEAAERAAKAAAAAAAAKAEAERAAAALAAAAAVEAQKQKTRRLVIGGVVAMGVFLMVLK